MKSSAGFWIDGVFYPPIAGGSGEDEDPPEDQDPPEGGEDQDPPEGEDGDEGKPGRTFTAAEVEAKIGKRVARLEREFKSRLEDAQKKAGMEETEKLKLEKEQAEARLAEVSTAAERRAVSAEAKVAALAAGVTGKRLPTFLRLVDLSDVKVDEDGEPDPDQVQAAIDAALKEAPEFKAAPGAGAPGASGKELGGGGGGKVWTRGEIDKLTAEEYAEHREEIMEQSAKGLIK